MVACPAPPAARPEPEPPDAAAVEEDSTPPVDSVREDTAVPMPDVAHPAPTLPGCTPTWSWPLDRDGDGYTGEEYTTSCVRPLDPPLPTGDCNEDAPTAFPGGEDRTTDGLDGDCDGWGSIATVDSLPLWRGINPDGHTSGSGNQVTVPGDLDADGFNDLVITEMGASYVVSGPIEANDVPQDLSTADYLIQGSVEADLQSTFPAGDVNGDGFPDLLFGGAGASYGVVYLLPGPLTDHGTSPIDLDAAATRFTGLEFNDSLELAIGPGDLDGDGLGDVALGANDAKSGAGCVYVLSGPVDHASVSEAEMTLQGTYREGLSTPVDLGDTNGDGVNDLGASGTLDSQLTYVVTEYATGVLHPSDLGTTIETFNWAWRGAVIYPAGDVNDDGLDDAAFTTWGPAMAVLFAGRKETELDLAADVDLTLYSTNEWAHESQLTRLAPLGDWDGDGDDDLALGNEWFVREADRPFCEPYAGCYSGAIFLLAGPRRGGTVDLEVEADRIEWSPLEWESGLGSELGGGGDVNGDGFPDLALGAAPSGAAFVVFGGG